MIVGKNITLRVFKEEDLPVVLELMNDVLETGEHYPLSIRTLPTLRKAFQDNGFWSRDSGRLLIVDRDDRIVGLISHFTGSHYSVGLEIGYQIFRRQDRGRGLMSEALRLYTALLFEMYPIERLQVCIDEENIGSWRVAEKCGYQYEGFMRHTIFERGEYRGSKVYSMIRAESKKLEEVMENI